ncbi:MAG: hypothetical protein SGCHY_003428, partial [Lobulomycetales sp.]
MALYEHVRFKSARYAQDLDESRAFQQSANSVTIPQESSSSHTYTSIPSTPSLLAKASLDSIAEDVNFLAARTQQTSETSERPLVCDIISPTPVISSNWVKLFVGFLLARAVSLFLLINSPESISEMFRIPPIFSGTMPHLSGEAPFKHWIAFDVVVSVVNHLTLIPLAWMIVSEQNLVSPRTNRVLGPNGRARFLIVAALLLYAPSTVVEPSILSRWWIGRHGNVDAVSRNCIVPPYLWFNASMPEHVAAIPNHRPLRPILSELPDQESERGGAYRFSESNELDTQPEQTLHGWAS